MTGAASDEVLREFETIYESSKIEVISIDQDKEKVGLSLIY